MALPPPEAKYPLVQYLKMERQYLLVIERLLSRAAKELSDQIAALPAGQPLTRAQLEATRAAIKTHMTQDWNAIERTIREGYAGAAAAASKVVSRYEDELLEMVMSRSEMELLAAGQAERAANTIHNALMRLTSSEKPLSQQVYTTKALTNKWVDDLITTALLKGSTAAQLAKAVRQFISPNVPGGASYAARRLARTEINNAFHAATVDRYQRSGIVEQVDWHLSTSHPEGDICDNLAADSPYDVKSVPEKPHPQCFCYTTAKLPDRGTFIDNLFAGKYGDEPWYDSAMVGE